MRYRATGSSLTRGSRAPPQRHIPRQLGHTARRKGPPAAGRKSPGHKGRTLQMRHQTRDIIAVIGCRITQLRTKCGTVLSQPIQLNRWQAPGLRDPRRRMGLAVGAVRCQMACTARDTLRTDTAGICPDPHPMCGPRTIAQPLPHRHAGRAHVTVGAPWVRGHCIDPFPGGQSFFPRHAHGLGRSPRPRDKQREKYCLHRKSMWLAKGNVRIRWPVAAKIALPNAGAAGGTPGSPMPLILSPFSKPRTSICGVWYSRMPSNA
jgi:hypothetical protein